MDQLVRYLFIFAVLYILYSLFTSSNFANLNKDQIIKGLLIFVVLYALYLLMAPNNYARREHYGSAKKWKCVEGASNELKSLHSYSSLSHLHILKEDGEFPSGNIFLRGTRNMGDLELRPSRDRRGPPGLFLPTDPGEIVLIDQQAPPRLVFVPSDGSSGYSLCNDYRNNKIKIEVVGVKNEKKWKCAEGTSNVLSMQPLFRTLNGFSIKKKNGEFPSGQMILSGTAGPRPISLFRPDPEDGQEPGYYMLGGTSLVPGEPLRISFSPDDRNSTYSLCDDYRNNKIVIEATGQ